MSELSENGASYGNSRNGRGGWCRGRCCCRRGSPQREAVCHPAINGVTGGTETVCGAFLAIGALSPMVSLGDDLLYLLAGSIDAPVTMAAGSMCAVDLTYTGGRAIGQRWVTR